MSLKKKISIGKEKKNDGDLPRRLHFRGRRIGKKLRVGQKKLLEILLPRLQINLLNPCPDFEMTMSTTPIQVWLEIGFGGGEHLYAQAKAMPKIGFIGCEPYKNGVVKLLRKIKNEHIENIRIFDDDASLLLEAMTERYIDRAFILFSDPWPKKRHHKRRFVNKDNLDLLAKVMKDGAELLFASDHHEFVTWSLEHLLNHSSFMWCAKSARDWRSPPNGWISTRYEEKALSQNLSPIYLRFKRSER